MSQPAANKSLQLLASNQAVCSALLTYLREKEADEVKTLNNLAVASLVNSDVRAQAQRQHGCVLFIRDMIFELEKSKI